MLSIKTNITWRFEREELSLSTSGLYDTYIPGSTTITLHVMNDTKIQALLWRLFARGKPFNIFLLNSELTGKVKITEITQCNKYCVKVVMIAYSVIKATQINYAEYKS